MYGRGIAWVQPVASTCAAALRLSLFTLPPFLAVSAVPARECPTSAPLLTRLHVPALPLYRRPAPHRPPTRPRPAAGFP
eukprot:7388133-Prymnesium_polylepis.1